MNISEHITLREATFSATGTRLGIKNEPNQDTIWKMKAVAERCFEPARKWRNKPIAVNSFFRCPELNKAVKGSSTSQHMKGEAIDMDAGTNADNKKLYEWCKANLVYDQLIWEYGDEAGPDWVHISFSAAGNRNETFKIPA